MNVYSGPISNLSLAGFQGMNSNIYLIQNDRNYEVRDMMSRLTRYSTHILKAVRKEKYDTIPRDLCMGFSWTMALANRFHIHIEDGTWKRFPGVCPYCVSNPCLGGNVCKQKSLERKVVTAQGRIQPATLREFQVLFREIYPYNTLKDSAAHLAEECAELSEAIEEYMGTHQPKLFEKIEEELVDVGTNQMAVASCLTDPVCNFDLASGLAQLFKNGCPGCSGTPCGCGFVVHNEHAQSVTLEK